MADPVVEKFSAGKFFGSFFQLIPWVKDIRTYAGLAILLFVGFTIYRAYFVKAQQQTQHNTTTVTGQSGSHITVEAPKQEMKSAKSHLSIGPFFGGSSDGDMIGGIIILYNF